MSTFTDRLKFLGVTVMQKKTVYGIMLALVLITIALLTFQDSVGTAKLSETVRLWFEKIGIHSDHHSFRSNAHLVEYFVLGVALSLFGQESGWCWWMVLMVGCGFGLIDEGIKILLPTREFDSIDLSTWKSDKKGIVKWL